MKNSALFLFSLVQMAMATSLALANPKQDDNVMSLPSIARVSIACNGIACRSTEPTRPSTDPPAADWTTRMFVRNCLEPAEGSAHFYDVTTYRSPPHMQDELLLSKDCGPGGDDDAED
jgi:hypothetical protein